MRDVTLEFPAGTVTAIVGDNGAGKSTLIKMLCGAAPPDRGHLELRGEPVRFATPAAAQRAGHRDRLPGPRARRPPQRRPEPVPRPRAAAPLGTGAAGSTWREMRREAESSLRRPEDPHPRRSAARCASSRAGSARASPSPGPCTRARGPADGRADGRPRAPGAGPGQRPDRATSPNAGSRMLIVSHNLDHVFRSRHPIAVMRLGRLVGVRDTSAATPAARSSTSSAASRRPGERGTRARRRRRSPGRRGPGRSPQRGTRRTW